MTPVKAVKTFKELLNSGKGSIFLSEDKTHFMVNCPGCGDQLRIPVKQEGAIQAKPWDWNGSVEKVTVKPSIVHVKGRYGCGWHGWLTDGVFKEC